MQHIHKKGPGHGQQIDTRVIIKVFVLFFDDGLAQEGRDFLQFRLHTPLLIVGKKGVGHFTPAVLDDGGIFDLVRQGKYPVEEEEEQEACGRCYERPYQQAFDGPLPNMSKYVFHRFFQRL
jgi:hypothetical protein